MFHLHNTSIEDELTKSINQVKMVFFVCDGYKPEMDRFYDEETEAELLFMYYLKLDSIKSGTSNSIGKLLGL